ncbi:50S ribosomal protein L29 [Candidatus Omnitrophota bacterium]
MKTEDIRNLTKEELAAKENELKKQLYDLSYQRKFGRVEKPHMFNLIKKDIARIKTIAKEKIHDTTKSKT